jgi:hypothetical protein
VQSKEIWFDIANPVRMPIPLVPSVRVSFNPIFSARVAGGIRLRQRQLPCVTNGIVSSNGPIVRPRRIFFAGQRFAPHQHSIARLECEPQRRIGDDGAGCGGDDRCFDAELARHEGGLILHALHVPNGVFGIRSENSTSLGKQ